MKDENSLYWIWLSEKCGIASKEFGRLAERYDNPFDLYRLEEDEIEHLEGIGDGLKLRLCDKALDNAYATLRYCKQNRVDIVGYSDPRYPARLRSIEDPPVLLYVLGKMPDMNNRLCVGMVGTRKMSEYGRQTAYKISYELAAAHAVIVSGMALGVDGVSACGALAAGGSTVAVLGCGISVTYPKEHAKLMKEIGKHGAVITEYPPAERPIGRNFPRRNRIISGLCQGVLVVEGAIGSGALITAKKAVSQGRDLFALPGKVNESNSDGPNELIRNGALVALCTEDIVRHYDFLYHDIINYTGLQKAKAKNVPVDDALRRYGVASLYDRGSYVPTNPAVDHGVEEGAVRPATASVPEKIAHEPRTDVSAEALAALDEVTRRIFERMPIDRAVAPDGLTLPDVDTGTVITSLTMLELSGLISSLPGGLYVRK